MAHKLAGDVRDFASLEHADPGAPKTTNLDDHDEDDEDTRGQRPASASETAGQPEEVEEQEQDDLKDYLKRQQTYETIRRRIEMIKMDKEDVVTVKYFPIKLAKRPTDECKSSGSSELPAAQLAQNFKQSAKLTARDRSRAAEASRPALATKLDESEVGEDKKDHQQRDRILERIRENFSLFETDRDTTNSNAEYSNRGHLQSIILQKQNQLSDNSSLLRFYQPLATASNTSSRLNDQYTQYRASDLIAPSTNRVDQQQSLPSLAPRRAHRVTLKSLPGDKRDRKPNKESIRDKRTSSLERSVSSLNELLKRPLELVKLRGRFTQESPDQRVHPSIESHHKEVGTSEEQYKVPTKQSFASSSTLYLLPAPDYTVHIATLVVKNIILSHQRAKHKRLIAKANQPSTNPTRRLTKLFKTYSFRKSELESIIDNQRPVRTTLKLAHSQVTGQSFRSSKRQLEREEGRDSGYREQTLDHSVNKISAKVKMPSGKTEKASIVDNKDGTVRISYEPKEVGAHEIALRYNDEPIDDGPIVFYVDAVGTAKKKITAYGAGLTHGQAGEQNRFTINTGGLGSAKLNVVVEGPSKTQVDLSDNKDGTITVSYLPLSPGEYKIKVSFDGKQLVGSPFTTEVGDEGRQRSHLNVDRGSEHSLELKVGEDDLKTLDAIIVTPCGLEEPAELKLLKNGQLAIVFTPREQGDHVVNVKRRGNQISGSPFKFDVLSRDIGDAKQVRVSGKGLKEGKANAENEIIINTKEAGYGGLSVALEGPGRSEITSNESTEGTIKLAYTPYEPGQYSLIVKYADHVVPGSPFSIKVSGQGSNPQKESIKKFRKLVPVSEVNTECHFSFKQPGVSAYDLSAKIHTPQGDSEDVSVKDKGDFVYQVSFVPKEVGMYALSIRNKDIHIAGSPFPYTVGTLVDFGPHKVRVGGPGLIKGSVNKANMFDVYTREAGSGELSVIMEGPSKPELTYTDRKDGSCHVGYKVSQPGEYRVSVFFNDHEVPESPFRTIIMPNTGDVAKIELGPMPPENMIQLSKPYNLMVIMNGAKGNIEGKVKLPSGKTEDCFASPIDAENWGVRFIPREFGIYKVYIKCKGSHIPQSPVFVRVGHDNADPAAILVHGHGLKGATVNHATDFTIETCNAGHSMLEVNIEGPSKVSMGCAELDEGYKINYTPLAPGEYLISIKYNGCHIGSSPFKVRAIKPPGSRTVADAGAHEIATIAISTTDREVKQKVEHMPKFKSDATRVYCKGMGLKKAFAGKPNTLTVNCSEAGFNMIYASFLGPTRNTIHECNVKHMGGQIYEIKYTCKDKGDAMLMVKYGEEQIPGSPFKLDVV